MAAAYCYERIPLRILASFFDIQMRYLVYISMARTLIGGVYSYIQVLLD